MEFITSKELYDQALGLFQVEIRKAGRGHLVFVTDENGNPVWMSNFEEQPLFYLGKDVKYAEETRVNQQNRIAGEFQKRIAEITVLPTKK